MTKAELWKLYTDKNPQFERDDKITLKREMLRKLFDQTYDIGFEHGKLVARIIRECANGNYDFKNVLASMGIKP